MESRREATKHDGGELFESAREKTSFDISLGVLVESALLRHKEHATI